MFKLFNILRDICYNIDNIKRISNGQGNHWFTISNLASYFGYLVDYLKVSPNHTQASSIDLDIH